MAGGKAPRGLVRGSVQGRVRARLRDEGGSEGRGEVTPPRGTGRAREEGAGPPKLRENAAGAAGTGAEGSSRPRAQSGWVPHPGPLARTGGRRSRGCFRGAGGGWRPGPSGGLSRSLRGAAAPRTRREPGGGFQLFPVAGSLGSFLTRQLRCSPLSTLGLSEAGCLIKPQPRRREKHQLKKNRERKLKTQKACCGDREPSGRIN